MYKKKQNWYFLLYFYLLVLNPTDGVRIRHHNKRKKNGSSLKNMTEGFQLRNYDEYYQSNPPDISKSDDIPPYTFLTISEINMDSISSTQKRFIEINVDHNPARRPPASKNEFDGWRILLIKGATMDIFMSIDLSAQTIEYTGSKIVVGDMTVPNVNIIFQNEKTEMCIEECVVDLDASPFAIILVATMNTVPHEMLTLPKEGHKHLPLSILQDENKQQLFLKYAYDVVVIGRRVPTNQCDFFTRLFPLRSYNYDFKYLLRDWDSPTSSVDDYSLNYCCRTFVPYSPKCYKLGHPSPGKENDCSGKRFIIETIINTVQRSRMSEFFIDVNSPLCNADFPGVPAYRYATLHDHDYAAAVARVMQTSSFCQDDDFYLPIDPVDSSWSAPVDTTSDDASSVQPKKYVESFDLQSFNRCKHHFSHPNDLLSVTYTSWLKFHPQDCRITCRICKTYFNNGWRPDKKNRSKVQKDGNPMSKEKYDNQKAVKNHVGDEIHAEAAQFLASLDSATSRKGQLHLEYLHNLNERARLQPTMNEVKLGYIELRARVSFRSHPLFMDGVSKLNVNVGFKHRTADSLQKICTTLSTSFHAKLLRSLINSDLFFSLICDGTTNRSVPYLVCLIQTLEDNAPIVYFWGLLVITTGESGYSMVEDLKIRVSEDDEKVPGFEAYFKRRIIAFVSDSASNMVGIHRSFYTHLQQYISKEIALVKCGAHKLQRAILHGINIPTDKQTSEMQERQHYFKSFTKINNQFYSFYMSRGSKRFQEFVELAEELDLQAYRINYFFDVRWAASHKRCMETLYNNYDALYADLGRIKVDTDFDDSGRSKALELYKYLADKTFPVVVAEFVDMLTVFKTMSERFQSKGGIMAGNVVIIRDGYLDIQFLQSQLGSFLKTFLSKCSCEGVCKEGGCSLEQYDECPEVKTKMGQKLSSRDDGTHTIRLSEFRSQLYASLLQQLIKYFEPETLEAFEIFNPKFLRGRCSSLHGESDVPTGLEMYYLNFQSIVPNAPIKLVTDRLKTICKFYHLSKCTEIAKEWEKFLEVLTKDAAAMKLRERDPAMFWSTVLSRDDLQIPLVVKDLIIRVLTTSFTSADAERAFSMVTNIKTQDRSSLSPSTLENLVRIAFNGPEILSENSAFEYTKDFVKVSSRVDDPSTVGGRPAKPEAFKSFFSKSRIF